MSEIPDGLHYTVEHEWIRIEEDGTITLGITDHAQDALTDIVYVELPDVGESFAVNAEFSVVESVKSASPIFIPFSGTVVAVNEKLDDTPELVNESPYGEGWITKFSKDFINHKQLKSQKLNGTNKRLVGLELIEKGIARKDYPILNKNGDKIGIVTSGTMSPTLEKAIALAYVLSEYKKLGTEVFVNIRNKRIKAVVTSLPFVK